MEMKMKLVMEMLERLEIEARKGTVRMRRTVKEIEELQKRFR